MGLDAFAAVCCAIPVLVSLLAVRVAYVLWRSGLPPKPHAAGLRCLIVLGSGGHTAEMMNIISELQKDRFTPRYYVAALTDNMSLPKAQVYEWSLIPAQGGREKIIENGQFTQIYRSREVGQSYVTSIATTLLAVLHAMWIVTRIRPQVIFCNGPGTCIPLCASAFLLKVLGLGWSSIFYIESIARVKKLSLSGLLLYKLRNEYTDYYKVLEVDYGASDDTIKLSYRRLALKWHPDKHKGEDDVTAKFQEINEAYKILSDPITRLEYDFSGGYEINQYTAREYLSRFKGMILTCNGLGIDHSSKWAQHMREWEPH
ncbi:hypothetical protein QYE76_024472 [Lolium multiflorum]|uniref:UDP-N-acetylglucosamine transferase subunit ALG14 n=1 Tax=Lolium multiflorum TaxID=4521 RepID=A0AAD8RDR4_LOLMU|nr:hypothetical protein QYE76_024472 [Lolium multiflorum]